MKMYIKLLATFALLVSISGCAEKEYIDRPVKLYMPVHCKTPDVKCKTDGNDVEVIQQLIECILKYKEANKVCK